MRTFLSLTLVSLLLLSSLGFHISMHLCDGELKDFAIMGKAKPCAHANPTNTTLPPCHSSKTLQKSKKGSCCQDRLIEIYILDKQYLGNQNIAQLHPQTSIICTFNSSELHLLPFQKVIAEYLYYKPPLLAKDIPVSIRSLLI